MTYLIPADKGTHFVVGVVTALAVLPLGSLHSAAACALAAIGREVYGRWRRAVPMTRYDWQESAHDAAATLAGGAAVLAAAWLGL